MKRILVLLLLCSGLLNGQDRSPGPRNRDEPDPRIQANDAMLGTDKVGHLMAGFVLTGIGTWIHQLFDDRQAERSVYFGMSFSMGAGLLKEFRDWTIPAGQASWKDLLADFLGCLLGGVVMAWVIQ